MGLQETDENGNLWFISSETSNKNFEIKEDTYVLGFNGNAELTTQLRIGAKDDKRKTN